MRENREKEEYGVIPRKEAPKTWTSTFELKLEDGASVSTCADNREAHLSCRPFRLDRMPLVDQLEPRNIISSSIKVPEVYESVLWLW